MAEQQWLVEGFLDTTLVTISITTDDQDLERGQDIGHAVRLAVERCLATLTTQDAANRTLGLTFTELRRRGAEL
jgi:hypothetical protein